jgi:3-hydroxyisobutyrate dehydrogenase-like beta-hydroxyacid dehydrogenase
MAIAKVGFLGMGLMGSRMARQLAKKGFEVVVWNRTRAKAEALAGPGIRVADSPRAVAEQVDAFCTCVSDPAALEQVSFGADGLFSGAKRGQLFVDFSTVSPELTVRLDRECEARGLSFVEAPVTGSKGGAEKGTLVIMAGATDAALAHARPIFEAVGEKVVHCGAVGQGSQVKLAGNAIIALMLEGFSEGLLLAQKAGVDLKKLIEVVQSSGYRSPYFDFKGKALMTRDFEQHFSIDLMFKDLTLFLESAARLKVPTPGVAAVREVYQLARASGRGELDIVATICPLEDVCGTKIGQPQ